MGEAATCPGTAVGGDHAAATSDGDPGEGAAADGARSVQAREVMDSELYDALRRMARGRMADQRRGHTLVATDLAHEAFLKLFRSGGRWTSRSHFLATAARAMRQVLVDWARRKKRRKRGEGKVVPAGADIVVPFEDRNVEVIVMDDLLRRLGDFDAQAATIADMRIFASMTTPEIAEVLGVSSRTVERDWAAARAWLRRRLTDEA